MERCCDVDGLMVRAGLKAGGAEVLDVGANAVDVRAEARLIAILLLVTRRVAILFAASGFVFALCTAAEVVDGLLCFLEADACVRELLVFLARCLVVHLLDVALVGGLVQQLEALGLLGVAEELLALFLDEGVLGVAHGDAGGE